VKAALSVDPTRRSCVELFEARPNKVPKAVTVEDTGCGIGRELGEKTDETVCGAPRDRRRGNDGQRHRRPGRHLGKRTSLQDGLREQGHEAIRPSLGGGLDLDDVTLVAAGDGEVGSSFGE
jgi:hypothetical protein